jgi:outer membrane protein assembly factor BamB
MRFPGLAKWTVRADGGFPSPPRNVNGQIYFSTRKTNPRVVTLHAIDAASGKVNWKFDAEAKLPDSDPVIAVRDMVMLGTDRGVFAVDRETGALRWSRIAKSNEMLGPVHTDGDLVYLINRSLDGNVHALHPATGEVKWSSSPGCCTLVGTVDRTVREIGAIQGNTIYATAPGFLYSLRRETGEVIWSFRVVNANHARPLIADGRVFISGAGLEIDLNKPTLGYFYAMDAATGRLRP